MVVSTSTIFYSLDETADQILYCSAGGSNVLSWRMLLKPAVLRERSGVSVVDAAWVGYVLIAVMVVVAVVVVRKCIECSRSRTCVHRVQIAPGQVGLEAAS